jgi:hypothetical protein
MAKMKKKAGNMLEAKSANEMVDDKDKVERP